MNNCARYLGTARVRSPESALAGSTVESNGLRSELRNVGVNRMKVTPRRNMMAMFLLMVVILGVIFWSPGAAAQRRYYGRNHHSRTKGALIGGAAGLLGGALIGGSRGALIGGAAGAGTGYLIQRHRNNRYRGRYRRYYR